MNLPNPLVNMRIQRLLMSFMELHENRPQKTINCFASFIVFKPEKDKRIICVASFLDFPIGNKVCDSLAP